jgi:hypothetical protein
MPLIFFYHGHLLRVCISLPSSLFLFWLIRMDELLQLNQLLGNLLLWWMLVKILKVLISWIFEFYHYFNFFFIIIIIVWIIRQLSNFSWVYFHFQFLQCFTIWINCFNLIDTLIIAFIIILIKKFERQFLNNNWMIFISYSIQLFWFGSKLQI